MKHDITSPNLRLSSKIKVLFLTVFFFVFGQGRMETPALADSEFEILITPRQLQSLPKNQLVLIDTRPKWKYVTGHIPGATHLGDWKEFSVRKHGVPGQINRDKTFIASTLSRMGIDNQKTIVIYGDLKDKWRTDGRFFWMFEFYGFKRTAILAGGIQDWEQAGFALERGFGKDPEPSSLKPSDIKFNMEVLADQEWIAQKLGSKDAVIIDNREKHEFHGATPYGSARGGHIPGAVHIDWREFFKSDGTLKDRKSLNAILNSHNIHTDQEIVVYCTGGVRSGMAYFVFRYLGYKVRNYDGSWWDWSRNPKLPIES